MNDRPKTLNQEMRTEQFTLSAGDVLIQFPSGMPADDFEDFSQSIDLLKRKLGRSVNESPSASIQEPLTLVWSDTLLDGETVSHPAHQFRLSIGGYENYDPNLPESAQTGAQRWTIKPIR